MWNLSSRVHPLNHFPSNGLRCYVKREDELSCGISGTKIRKYSSLVPFLHKHGIKHLIIIAGPQSNNLLAALQVAREHQFKVSVFLLKPKSSVVQGNFALSLLFIEQEDIHWVERSDWDKVSDLANNYLRILPDPAFILQEGASVPEAMSGSMSLAHDITHNEQQLGFKFDHIFIDAGTGFSAAALINGLAQLKHPALIHILLLADTEAVFQHKLQQWIGLPTLNYCCFYPQTARSFGAVNKQIKDAIRRMALEEGILTEPIYSAKLFHESRRYLDEAAIRGNVLIIHSGGILSLTGFNLY